MDFLRAPGQSAIGPVRGRCALEEVAREHGREVEYLAARTGLSVAYLSGIGGGERQLSPTSLFTIAQAYGVAFSELFDPEPGAGDCTVVRAAENGPSAAGRLPCSGLTNAGPAFNLRPLRVVVPAEREADVVYVRAL